MSQSLSHDARADVTGRDGSAYCGDIDLTGWRKPVSHYRSMLHNPGQEEKLYMAVREPDGYHGRIKETLWSVWPTWESD